MVGAAEAQLFQATLKNGDYGGGTAVAPNSGVVNTPDGVSFVGTEASGRSNALINWQLASADRSPFRAAGTISFCFRADRQTFVTGEIVGENYGFGQFNNGQATFGAAASRVLNGPGNADDQVVVTWQTWHNNVFISHSPSTRLEFDRVYRVGLAWGATPTHFEVWIDGVQVAADDAATLPWGSASLGTGSGTNFGLGQSHERGLAAYRSATGVTFSNVRIWRGYQASGDTLNGCRSMSISGPAGGLTGQSLTFEGIATGCGAAANGWSWTASQNGTVIGGSTRTVSVTWPSAGQVSLAVSNSGCSGLSATQNVTIAAAQPDLVVASFPQPLVQDVNAEGSTADIVMLNRGDGSITVALTQQGNFFKTSPASFAIPPRGSQVVTVTGTAQPANVFRGAVIPTGAGVPSGLTIPVVLLSASPPAAPPSITPNTNRVDVTGDPTSSPTGSVTFANSGAGTMSGAVVSTAPWLIPPSGLITIAPGESSAVQFTVDRSKRPDANSPLGSVNGDLQLVFRTPSAGKKKPTPLETVPVSVTTVSVVDTAKPAVTTGTIPALAPGEIALFVPGVGHVTGSVGVFVSDLAIVNTSAFGSIGDAKLYYTPLNGAASAQIVSLASLAAAQPFALADLVKSVFNNDAQVGSLQVRTKDISKVAVGASIFNASNSRGTFGTTIPVFRSDRGVAAGGKLYLTGLRHDATSHTNMYLQETAGLGATINSDFLSASGTVIGSRSDSIGPFVLTQLGGVVPEGAVSAVLTNSATSAGRFLAYATPVDHASGDTWAVTDWRQQDGYSGDESVLVPVAGALHGANSTYFRTDVAVMNTGSSTASGTFRYYNRNGDIIDKPLTLGGLETRVLNDVTTTFVGVSTDSVGHLVFIPSSGNFTVTSRTYTTVINDVATFGTGVPTRSFSGSLKPGDVRRIGGVDDSAIGSITAGRPATFRTSFAMVETAGGSANIRVTVRYSAATGLVASKIEGWKDYFLGPHQFVLLGSVAREVLGPGRDAYGDLRNLQIEFAHLGGNGTIDVFLSSVDNGTGDSILRME